MEGVYHIPTMEKRYIVEALIRSGNKTDKAAVMLGISSRTLSRKKIEHEIDSQKINELIKLRKNVN